jgi:D-tyrosyl-tRNA(Tyr) deacylase
MKAVVQRVKNASVTVDGNKISEIEHGLLLLLGVAENDSQEDIGWLSKKIANLRIFIDENGVMNTS